MRLQFMNIIFVAVLLLRPVTVQNYFDGAVTDDAILAVLAMSTIFLFIPGLLYTKVCEYPYTRFGNRCYKFKRTPLTWSEAKSDCAEDDADLVSIETSNESDWIVEQIEQLDEVKEYTLSTNGAFDPVSRGLAQFGINFIDRDVISFYVKGCSNAFINLKEGQEAGSNFYSVGFGTFQNTKVGIYKGSVTPKLKTQTSVSQIMDCNEFRPFWVSYKEGRVQAGTGLEKGVGVLLEWTDDMNYLDIRYVSVSDWNSNMLDWKFSSGREYWTSGHLNPETNYYEWASRKPAKMGFTNWLENIPTRALPEMECVAMDTTWDNNGGWNDEICTCKFGFICEKGLTKTR